jgi:hypothetical protein
MPNNRAGRRNARLGARTDRRRPAGTDSALRLHLKGRQGRESRPRTLAAAGAAAFTDDGAMVDDDSVMREAMRCARHSASRSWTTRSCRRSPETAWSATARPPPPGPAALSAGSRVRSRAARQSVSAARPAAPRTSAHLMPGSVAALRARAPKACRSPASLAPPSRDRRRGDSRRRRPHRMNPPSASATTCAPSATACWMAALPFRNRPRAHTAETKDARLPQSRVRLIGLETAVGVTWRSWSSKRGLPPLAWVARWTTGPRRAAGRPAPSLASVCRGSLGDRPAASRVRVAPDSFRSSRATRRLPVGRCTPGRC